MIKVGIYEIPKYVIKPPIEVHKEFKLIIRFIRDDIRRITNEVLSNLKNNHFGPESSLLL